MKSVLKSTFLTFAILWSFITYTQESIVEELSKIAIMDQKIMVSMRDGIRLCTDVYRPKGSGKVPTIFSRTPYNFNSYGNGEMRTRTFERAYEAVKRGYAYVIQNERGRFFSEGEWDILGTPLTDGYDAMEWMKNQSWSNGKVGTYGCSSTAEWQMAVASLDHPAHAAMVPMGFGAGVGKVGEYYEQGNWFRGGAVQMLFISWLYGTQNDEFRPLIPAGATQEDLTRIQQWFDLAPEMPSVDWKEAFKHLPAQDIIKNVNGSKGVFEKMIRRTPNDPDWYKGGLYHDNMPFNIPSFWFVSWYDVSSSPNLELYNHVRGMDDRTVADNQYLVIAPTLHCRYTRATENTIVGQRNMGDARLDYDGLIYGWFDKWLKDEDDNTINGLPHVQYYTMGSNQWQSSDTWPPVGAEFVTYYLNSGGKANSLYGDGKLQLTKTGDNNSPDSYVYDPNNPVPSHGGNVCCTGGAIDGGAYDQRSIEMRHDVLVYTSDPLNEGVEVSGFIESTLYVGSDAKDTDFTIKLIDVYPDGTAYNLDETIFRARYREGFDKEVFMEDDQVYKIEMSPMSTSNFFKKGHQIRIEISSSNFPRFDRNLNTGGKNFDESSPVNATNKIYHSGMYPSQVRLPIVK